MQSDTTNSGAADAGEAQSRPSIAEQAKSAARREIDDASERLAGAARTSRGAASKAGRSIQHLVIEELDKRKDGFFEGLEAVTGTIRKAADELDQNEDALEAPGLVHQAVNTIEDMTDRLKYQSVEEIGQILSRYGRENPTLFVAGAMLAGLAVGRFFVASSSEAGRVIEDWDDAWDRNASYREAFQGLAGRSFAQMPGQPSSTEQARDAHWTGRQNDPFAGSANPKGDKTTGAPQSYGQFGSGKNGGAGQRATTQPAGVTAQAASPTDEGVTQEAGGGAMIFASGAATPMPTRSSRKGENDGTS